jgi:hypothetical protein
VLTLGTPHLGTPFVGRALGLAAGPLSVVGRVAAVLRMDTLTDSHGVPISDPFTLATAYMLRPGDIPEGHRSMGEGSDALAALARLPGARQFTAVGGKCDLPDAPAGFLPAFRAVLADEVFSSEPNDLVVALRSSAPGDGDHPITCTHSEYFHDDTVQRLIRAPTR